MSKVDAQELYEYLSGYEGLSLGNTRTRRFVSVQREPSETEGNGSGDLEVSARITEKRGSLDSSIYRFSLTSTGDVKNYLAQRYGKETDYKLAEVATPTPLPKVLREVWQAVVIQQTLKEKAYR